MRTRNNFRSFEVRLPLLLTFLLIISGLLLARLSSVGSAQQSSTVNRPSDPVVLTGAQVPAFLGSMPGDLVGFRNVNGAWEQIPIQVDEKDFKDLGSVNNRPANGIVTLTWVDPNTWAGPDSNPTFDPNDELVFMAKDAGGKPALFSQPPGVVSGSGIEVRVTDPLEGTALGYVYLFRRTGVLDPSAGKQYVNYQFVLLSGNYKATYNTGGPNPENSSIATPYYRHTYDDRWLNRELKITVGNSTGVDILDSHKVMVAPTTCFRTEETFANSGGSFIVNKNGPVRAIRSYMGANSGPYTQRDHIFYERRQDIASYHRVHEIGSSIDFLDYSPQASGMHYYNSLNTGGVVINGVSDAIATGQLAWEMVTGPQGSLAMVHRGESNIPNLIPTSYYLDSTNPSDPQCTGDAFAYGASGVHMLGILCTDPNAGQQSCTQGYYLRFFRHFYYEAPVLTVSDAENRKRLIDNPLVATLQPWTGSAPTPTPTPSPTLIQFAVLSFDVNEGGGSASVNVTRTGEITSPASVSYATSDNAGLNNCNVLNSVASARCDYTTAIGMVRFAAGENSKIISIPIVDDSYAEGSENFTISLNNANGGTLGTPSIANVSIADNETSDGPNPIEGTAFFVRQHYLDFLNREPDPGGYAAWQAVINGCLPNDQTCDRIHVSSSFFRSAEFQGRGYFVYRFYPVSFGRKPDYVEFTPDIARVSGFLSEAELESAKAAFVAEFMARPAFIARFNGLNNTEYVDLLLATAGVAPHQFRDFWITGLGNGTLTRAQVLRDIAESPEVYNKYYNQAFVVMQYFGYLRRQPDAQHIPWIQHLDSTGDFRSMINGFMNSPEYRARFGP